jgi:hypothetical protein
LEILGEVPIYSIEYDTDYETTLLNSKTTIESKIITNYSFTYPAIFNNGIGSVHVGEYTTSTITLQEFLDLFEE